MHLRLSSSPLPSLAGLIAGAVLLAGPGAARAATVIRVPADAPGLQQAVARVPDGGVIELAAGRYPSPATGFDFSNLRKAFTVRAARGAQVVLDGGGTRPIVKLRNGQRSRGKLVTFEDLAFENAASTAEVEGGAVSLAAAEARFVRCRFTGNQATGRTTGGGAVGLSAGSEASFLASELRDNRSGNRGGAISAIDSKVNVQGGAFVGNRTNGAGHSSHAAGGAIYVLNSVLRVADARFESNEAAYTGGAIYGFGTWRAPDTVPRADLLVTGSTFTGNRAAAGSGSPPPGAPSGGAIHVEDQAALSVVRSRFVENVAGVGGAIDTYRAVVAVEGSVFQGNRAVPDGDGLSRGAAFAAASADFNDGSTGAGAAINRRPAQLEVRDSLVQGRFGSTGVAAETGGCLWADGDVQRVFGTDPQVPRQGTLADNRVRVHLAGVVFSDCDAEGGTAGDTFGGAVSVDVADLAIERSLFLGNDARGEGAGGGALAVLRGSDARIADTAFAGNSAAATGGALHLSGSVVRTDRSSFLGNEVSPGTAEAAPQSRGAAIYSIPFSSRIDPSQARPVSGVVAGSLFSGDVGMAVFDIEGADGPANEVRYDGNRFFERTFDDRVYTNIKVDRDGMTVAELNGLVVTRPGGATDKSVVPNQALSAAPAAGALVAVPPGAGAPGSQAPGFLGFAWSGRGATLSGPGTSVALAARFGVREASVAGEYRLLADGAPVATAALAAPGCTVGPTLCIAGGRFRVEVRWEDFNHLTGYGQAVALTPDTGYFWFFNPANVELVTKVVDGRQLGGNFWVFYGALSSVAYTMTVTDTTTGRVRTYQNGLGHLGSVADTAAFPGTEALSAGDAAAESNGEMSGSAPPGEDGDPSALESLDAPIEAAEAAATSSCTPGPTALCLNGGRFRVEATFKDFQGKAGVGMAVPLTADTGYFWFFNSSNVEVVLKVIDGRPLNGRFWIFYGALSTVEYTLTVTDTQNGNKTVTYHNPSGRLASVADTTGLPGG